MSGEKIRKLDTFTKLLQEMRIITICWHLTRL